MTGDRPWPIYRYNGAVCDESGHMPVLVEPVLALLAPRPGQVVLDCTIGQGGHAELIVPQLAPGGRYVGLDVDPANAEFARRRLADAPVRVDVVHANFVQAPTVLEQLGLSAADALLADLGVSSNQLDDPARGLSFAADGLLDMRLDPALPRTAAHLVNHLSERELADLIYRYGEERLSRKIARKIVEQRARSPIDTTAALAHLVRQVYWSAAAGRKGTGKGSRRDRRVRSRIDPATRTFMALRIAVNNELAALEQLLADVPALVAKGGVAAVISFHSLEDRPVKRAFSKLAKQGLGEVLTRKPLTADTAERAANPRSRSAKLRALRMAGTGSQAA